MQRNCNVEWKKNEFETVLRKWKFVNWRWAPTLHSRCSNTVSKLNQSSSLKMVFHRYRVNEVLTIQMIKLERMTDAAIDREQFYLPSEM